MSEHLLAILPAMNLVCKNPNTWSATCESCTLTAADGMDDIPDGWLPDVNIPSDGHRCPAHTGRCVQKTAHCPHKSKTIIGIIK